MRFIEYMPFDGNVWSAGKLVPYRELMEAVQARYGGELQALQQPRGDVAKDFQVSPPPPPPPRPGPDRPPHHPHWCAAMTKQRPLVTLAALAPAWCWLAHPRAPPRNNQTQEEKKQ